MDEFIDIDIKYVGDDLILQAFGEDMIKEDLVGEAKLKISAFCIGNGFDDWFQI